MAYLFDKETTEGIKKFLSENTRGKLMDDTDYQVNKDKTLPIRGELQRPLKKKKAK